MNEKWKSIDGYEGLYEVSDLGNVRNVKTGKLRKGSSDRDGYLHVSLHKNKKVKTYFIHRLVAIAFIENPDNLPQVNHKDECKTNNNVENLEWCTALYNTNYGTRNVRASISISLARNHSCSRDKTAI